MSTTEKKPKAKRPSKFTPALKARICREVGLGKSLRSVLKRKDMPSMSRVMEVLQVDAEWSEQYAHARRRGIESHIDGLVDLADEATEDNAHAVRLRVDTRKWIASKLLPKIYGDKLEIEADVRDTREPVDRPTAILEAGRRIAFMLYQAGELQRDRETQALLPVPAADGQSAGIAPDQRATAPHGAPDAASRCSTVAVTPPPDAPAAPATDQPERTVDYGGRLSESADAAQSMRTAEPLQIAANRYRPRWQRS